MLKSSALETLQDGQFTSSNQLMKPNYLFILLPIQYHSFLRNLPPLFLCCVDCQSRHETLVLTHKYVNIEFDFPVWLLNLQHDEVLPSQINPVLLFLQCKRSLMVKKTCRFCTYCILGGMHSFLSTICSCRGPFNP